MSRDVTPPGPISFTMRGGKRKKWCRTVGRRRRYYNDIKCNGNKAQRTVFQFSSPDDQEFAPDCADDDSCLQSMPHFGGSDTCSGNANKCTGDRSSQMHICCALTCNTCPIYSWLKNKNTGKWCQDHYGSVSCNQGSEPTTDQAYKFKMVLPESPTQRKVDRRRRRFPANNGLHSYQFGFQGGRGAVYSNRYVRRREGQAGTPPDYMTANCADEENRINCNRAWVAGWERFILCDANGNGAQCHEATRRRRNHRTRRRRHWHCGWGRRRNRRRRRCWRV